jgi:hypothetical protein
VSLSHQTADLGAVFVESGELLGCGCLVGGEAVESDEAQHAVAGGEVEQAVGSGHA